MIDSGQFGNPVSLSSGLSSGLSNSAANSPGISPGRHAGQTAQRQSDSRVEVLARTTEDIRSSPGNSPATLPSTTRGDDRVEVSAMAFYLSKLQQLPAVREDLVKQVRAEIASGTYDTPEKFSNALDELLSDLKA